MFLFVFLFLSFYFFFSYQKNFIIVTHFVLCTVLNLSTTLFFVYSTISWETVAQSGTLEVHPHLRRGAAPLHEPRARRRRTTMASSTTAVDFEHCVQAPMTLRVPQDWKNPSRASSNHLDAMSPSTRDLGTSQGAKDVLACTSSAGCPKRTSAPLSHVRNAHVALAWPAFHVELG